MRIIRTELFFERSAFRWMTFDYAMTSEAAERDARGRSFEPNISIAWIKLDYEEPLEPEWSQVSLSAISAFVRRTLVGVPGMDRASVGPDLLEAVLSSEIVVEQSPPTTVRLRDLVAKAGRHATGVTLGFAAAAGNPELLMLTVPAGVIIMGTAKGISLGLEEGLHKLIKDALSSKRNLKL